MGCDLVLGSYQVKDRCGVCGGNGSSCTQAINSKKSQYVVPEKINTNVIRSEIAKLQNSKSLTSYIISFYIDKSITTNKPKNKSKEFLKHFFYK